MKAKPIMLQGTASGVGKTILTLALCRIFKQDGYKVAPFKAQNMTSNTCLTPAGDEIAMSQHLQALAAGIEPCLDMNPILLKPPFAGQKRPEERAELIMQAYERLSEQYEIIVIEGAGSPVELNLNKNDVINMGMAKKAAAPVLLVSDIDRGGVFASLYGTIALLGEAAQSYVKATIVNRFKGDVLRFSDGVTILEEITKIPVAGVIPFVPVNLPEEDSLYEGNNSLASDFEKEFDSIAKTVRSSLDMELIYQILDGGMSVL